MTGYICSRYIVKTARLGAKREAIMQAYAPPLLPIDKYLDYTEHHQIVSCWQVTGIPKKMVGLSLSPHMTVYAERY
jgi:hypothetical protein